MQVGIHVLRPSALPIVEVSPIVCLIRVHLPSLVCTAEAKSQHPDAPRRCRNYCRGLHLQNVCNVAADVTAGLDVCCGDVQSCIPVSHNCCHGSGRLGVRK